MLSAAGRSCPHIAIKIPLEKTWLVRLMNRLRLKSRQSRFFESEGHLYEFDRTEVEALLQQAGLTIHRTIIDYMPKDVMFNPYRTRRMRSKAGARARLNYFFYCLLSALPYPLSRPFFKTIDGVDFFILGTPRKD